MPSMAAVQWDLYAAGTVQDTEGAEWLVTDHELVANSLPSTAPAMSGLASLSVPVLANPRSPAVAARRKAAAVQVGFPELLVYLEASDPGDQRHQRLLVALSHVLRKGPAPVVVCALADDLGAQLVALVAKKHSQHASLTSLTSHLMVAVCWDVIGACEKGLKSEDSLQDTVTVLENLASSAAVFEMLMGHLVLGAVRSETLFTQRGLVTNFRALQSLFLLQIKGLKHSQTVKKLCTAADLPGRMLQVLSYPPQTHLPAPGEPTEAGKHHSCGELYLNLVAAVCTYIGYSSGIFNAPGGQLTLDSANLAVSSAWLLAPNRLECLRAALDTLTQSLYHNALLEHVECPETRHLDAALKNVLFLMTLPLCSSNNKDDKAQLTTFYVQYFTRLYRLDYLPLFNRILEASHPSDSGASGPASTTEGAARPHYYKDGECQAFFAGVAGVMIDAITTLGAASQDLDRVTASEEEMQQRQEFIKLQLPRVEAWRSVLSEVLKLSQQPQTGYLEYRPATKGPEGATGARKCAQCGARPEKLSSCQRCGVARYCSRDCQVAHWGGMHKLQCKQLQQQVSDVLSKSVVG